MKVLILTQGTLGDVQPFVALAQALTAAGHEVTLGAPAISASLVKPYNIELVPFSNMGARLISDSSVRHAFEQNYRGISGMRLIPRVIKKYHSVMEAVLEEIAECASKSVDIVVHHVTVPGHEIAECIGVPAVPVCLTPSYASTNKFSDPMLPISFPRPLNRASYYLSRLWLRTLVGNTTEWRRERLKLPKRRGHRDPFRRPDGTYASVLCAYSRHVLPSMLNYPRWVHTTGFWYLPTQTGWTPSAELSEFVTGGTPPVCIGFGSLVGATPGLKGRIVHEAVRMAQVRAVIVGGSGGIRFTHMGEEDLLCVDHAPFEWLFPRTAAIVHHGGSGTTGVALAAGRPQVICPAVYGQPFNALRMYHVGVAPKPQPQRTLTAEGLAQAIRLVVTESSFAERANELRYRIRSEDGLAQSISVLESVAMHSKFE